jgi:Fe-S-cluster containining protein
MTDVPDCLACGRCCTRSWLVAVEKDEPVPEDLVKWVPTFGRAMRTRQGGCIAYDRENKVCSIYEERPKTCREFERGSSACRAVLGLEILVRV